MAALRKMEFLLLEAMTYSEVFRVGVRARARVNTTVRVRVSGSDDLLGGVWGWG